MANVIRAGATGGRRPASWLALLAALTAPLLAALAAGDAWASPFPSRVYVASTGADANASANCPLSAPCRTFATAVTVVAVGGDVVALDTGGFGPVTITRSLTLSGPAGTYAGITSANPGYGITINAPGGNVRIRGLTIETQQPNTAYTINNGIGIMVLAAANVSLENCVIAGFPYGGIMTLPSPLSTQATPLTLNVIDTVFIESGNYAAIYLQPSNFKSGGTVTANIRHVSMNGYNLYTTSGNEGFLVGDGVSASIDDCQVVNYLFGLIATDQAGGNIYLAITNSVWNNAFWDVNASNNTPTSIGGGTAHLDLRNNLFTGTTTTNAAVLSASGLPASFGGAFSMFGAGFAASLNGNTFSGNSLAVNIDPASVVSSYGNNHFATNGTDVTGTLTPILAK